MSLTSMETNEMMVAMAWMKVVSHGNISLKKVERRLTRMDTEVALAFISKRIEKS